MYSRWERPGNVGHNRHFGIGYDSQICCRYWKSTVNLLVIEGQHISLFNAWGDDIILSVLSRMTNRSKRLVVSFAVSYQ